MDRSFIWMWILMFRPGRAEAIGFSIGFKFFYETSSHKVIENLIGNTFQTSGEL